MNADEEERWAAALAWFVAATEDEIDAIPEGFDRTRDDWLRLAMVAIDQSGIDPRRVVTT